MDNEQLAREAISYLMFHDLVFTWNFADDPPSEEIRRLIMPYMDGIQADFGNVVSRYLTSRLADDFLGLCGIDISPEVSPPPGT
jgi:hypothetical protein